MIHRPGPIVDLPMRAGAIAIDMLSTRVIGLTLGSIGENGGEAPMIVSRDAGTIRVVGTLRTAGTVLGPMRRRWRHGPGIMVIIVPTSHATISRIMGPVRASAGLMVRATMPIATLLAAHPLTPGITLLRGTTFATIATDRGQEGVTTSVHPRVATMVHLILDDSIMADPIVRTAATQQRESRSFNASSRRSRGNWQH